MVTHRIPFMRGECYSILAALCIAAGLGSQRGFAAAHECEVESNWRDDSVTQLWIHGAGRIPEQAAELGAQGLRFIHNLRAGPPQSAEAILARYADAGVGLCLTLRWADSAEQSAISKTDTPPSAEESAAAKSFRNLPKVLVLDPSTLDVSALVWARSVLVSEAALVQVKERAR